MRYYTLVLHIKCSNLITMDLTRNNLTGQISFHFDHISKLLILRLGRKGYPIYFGKSFISLAAFSGIQSLGGGIPHDLSRLKCLKYLYLDVNNLSGMIPPSLYNCSSAIEFFVSGNILSGNFTPNMRFNFPQLRMSRPKTHSKGVTVILHLKPEGSKCNLTQTIIM